MIPRVPPSRVVLRCSHCGGLLIEDNPEGFCDHTRWPESCSVCMRARSCYEERLGRSNITRRHFPERKVVAFGCAACGDRWEEDAAVVFDGGALLLHRCPTTWQRLRRAVRKWLRGRR